MVDRILTLKKTQRHLDTKWVSNPKLKNAEKRHLIHQINTLLTQIQHLQGIIGNLDGRVTHNKNWVMYLEQKMARLEQSTKCVVCWKPFSREILFLPCKHFSCCPQCSKKLTNCPLCRSVIASKIKVFF